MKTLTIKDLSFNEALDAKTMTGVRGGMYKEMPKYWMSTYFDGSQYDSSLKADQSIAQSQNVFNANGNNVAFAGNITSTVNPVQKATNNVIR